MRKFPGIIVYDFYYKALDPFGHEASGVVLAMSSRHAATKYLQDRHFKNIHVWLDEEEKNNGRRIEAPELASGFTDEHERIRGEDYSFQPRRNPRRPRVYRWSLRGDRGEVVGRSPVAAAKISSRKDRDGRRNILSPVSTKQKRRSKKTSRTRVQRKATLKRKYRHRASPSDRITKKRK